MKYTSIRHALGYLSLIALVFVTNACNRQREAKETWETEMTEFESVAPPSLPPPDIQSIPDSVLPPPPPGGTIPPPPPGGTIPPPPQTEDHSSTGEKAKPSSISSPVKKVTLSREYQEGYDNGYDDGEDDAVGDNGYGGQYDDACRYKGKKRRDYEEGYEDGYEAGYYDNNDLDD